MVLTCSTAMLSRAGGRARNEDALATSTADDGTVWGVADGLGGHAGGEVASRVAVEAAMAAADAMPVTAAASLAARVRAAHAAVRQAQAQESALRGMRSTLALLAIDGRSARWAHVGDTRLYRFREGRIVAATRDHTVAASLERGPQRDVRGGNGRNALLRTLGDPDAPIPDLSPEAVVLGDGDAFLLCSDGWWGEVLESEMEIDLAGASSPQDWLQRMEDRLLERAADDFDNYTAIAVWCAVRDRSDSR